MEKTQADYQKILDDLCEKVVKKFSILAAKKFGHLINSSDPLKWFEDKLRACEHKSMFVISNMKSNAHYLEKSGQIEISKDYFEEYLKGAAEEKFEHTILHELAHKVTSESPQDYNQLAKEILGNENSTETIKCGFQTFGRDAGNREKASYKWNGINEGATELFVEKILGKEYSHSPYYGELDIARQLSDIMGEDKFFSAMIHKEELKTLDPKIMKIFDSVDVYHKLHIDLVSKMLQRKNSEDDKLSHEQKIHKHHQRVRELLSSGDDTDELVRMAKTRQQQMTKIQDDIKGFEKSKKIREGIKDFVCRASAFLCLGSEAKTSQQQREEYLTRLENLRAMCKDDNVDSNKLMEEQIGISKLISGKNDGTVLSSEKMLAQTAQGMQQLAQAGDVTFAKTLETLYHGDKQAAKAMYDSLAEVDFAKLSSRSKQNLDIVINRYGLANLNQFTQNKNQQQHK